MLQPGSSMQQVKEMSDTDLPWPVSPLPDVRAGRGRFRCCRVFASWIPWQD